MKIMLRTLLLTLSLIAFLEIVHGTRNPPNPGKWVPANFTDTSEYVQTVARILNLTVTNEGLELDTVKSFESRPLMIGRSYRAIYNATSLNVSYKSFLNILITQINLFTLLSTGYKSI